MPQNEKKFYGSVTVSDRGQIVIPAEARRDFNIKTGDKLLAFGDLTQGVAFTTLEIMSKTMGGTMQLFREIAPIVNPDAKPPSPGRKEP